MVSLLNITLAVLGLPLGLICIIFGLNALIVLSEHDGVYKNSYSMLEANEITVFGIGMFLGGIGIIFYSGMYLAVGRKD